MKTDIKVSKFILQNIRFNIHKKYTDNELKRPGIYAILNIKNGHTYIGQSIDLFSRRKHHFNELDNGRHANPYLQNAYNCYGKGCFRFVVLEFIDNRDELSIREQFWIEFTPSVYNLMKNVFEYPPRGIDKKNLPDGINIRNDDNFERPDWHAWVYGGARNPILDR